MRVRANLPLLVTVAVLTAGTVALAQRGLLAFAGSDDWLGFVEGQSGDLWVPLAYFAVFLAVAMELHRVADRLGRKAWAGALAVLTAGALALLVATGTVTPEGPVESVPALALPRTNVFYHNARTRIRSIDQYARQYDKHVRGAKPVAVRTHPPGPELFYFSLRSVYLAYPGLRNAALHVFELTGRWRGRLRQEPLKSLFERHGISPTEAEVAAATAFTLKLLACLVVVPVYLLGAGLRSRRTGLVAALFAALLPSVHCFSPGLDQVYPFFAALLAWLALTAVKERCVIAGVLFGLLLCVSLLFSLAFVVVAGLVALVCVSELPLARRARAEGLAVHLWWGVGAGAVVGFLVPVIVFRATWDINLFQVWVRCLRANADFNVSAGRTYGPALLSNPIEYLVFLGVPLACLFIGSVRWGLRTFRGAPRVAAAVLCFAVLMIVLNLTGTNRGEVARLWMFTMPFCAVAAAWWLTERHASRLDLSLLLLVQLAQVACFRVWLDTLRLYSPT